NSKKLPALVNLLFTECVVNKKGYCELDKLEKIWPKKSDPKQEKLINSVRKFITDLNRRMNVSDNAFKIYFGFQSKKGIEVILNPERIFELRKKDITAKKCDSERIRRNSLNNLKVSYEQYCGTFTNQGNTELGVREIDNMLNPSPPQIALRELKRKVSISSFNDIQLLDAVKKFVRRMRNINYSNRNSFPESNSLEDVARFMENYEPPKTSYFLDEDLNTIEFQCIELSFEILSEWNANHPSHDDLKKQYFGHLDLQRLFASSCCLREIKFNNCRFDYAAFNEGILMNADFTNSFLCCTGFEASHIIGSNFSKSCILYTKECLDLKGMSFRKASMIGSIFDDCYFENVDFARAVFKNASFERSIFKNCIFKWNVVENVSFHDSIFIGCEQPKETTWQIGR
ncbi:MAG: pentapeptide repeat-containing protein, partial [Bacteroidetes bacterium]|nr:pentapeptide repeat-containing protein [Bacteroidota bacterium]